MIVNSIDIENIVTMLKALPDSDEHSDVIKFAKGSHKLVDGWDEFIKRLK